MNTAYFSEKEFIKSASAEHKRAANMASTVVQLAILLVTVALIVGIVRASQAQTAVIVQENLSAFADKEEVLVILYGKEGCAACKQAVEELQTQNIAFVYRDINNPEALEEFTNFEGRNVPMVITRYLKVTGYNKEWFERSVLVENRLPNAPLINMED